MSNSNQNDPRQSQHENDRSSSGQHQQSPGQQGGGQQGGQQGHGTQQGGNEVKTGQSRQGSERDEPGAGKRANKDNNSGNFANERDQAGDPNRKGGKV